MTAEANPTSPQAIETYTLLQIAAETFLGSTKREDPAARPGSGAIPVTLGEEMLMKGNLHSSKMTTEQAKQFALEWKVVSHQPNTATGFSGTLFQYMGETDPVRGLQAGQFVVSFRSTEFIEDYARDCAATNDLEVKTLGWAIGQISDMKTWWDSVKGEVGTSKVAVTGYSLGGHLATSFYEMYGPDSIDKVFTFNGAGVGSLKDGNSLNSVIQAFRSNKADGANRGAFSDPATRTLITSSQVLFNRTPAWNLAANEQEHLHAA
ncbi:hypothetical protein [Pelomonas sp. BJYL3]|uniref:hypothetical protein n=1 Tax=Pelomonas sp. BJYL3 TaxID=2976697 RepID=UPI0022B4638E|nr:hypothetical protein [Pelomonas sp. BJYL3]